MTDEDSKEIVDLVRVVVREETAAAAQRTIEIAASVGTLRREIAASEKRTVGTLRGEIAASAETLRGRDR